MRIRKQKAIERITNTLYRGSIIYFCSGGQGMISGYLGGKRVAMEHNRPPWDTKEVHINNFNPDEIRNAVITLLSAFDLDKNEFFDFNED